jgi:DNA polymerase III delta' subunit
MDNALTRGQNRAVAEIGSMIRGRAPHAVLLVGPGSVGKTTLAMDLAAGLLCQATDPDARPCRACRGCRLVASGNHPDLHRLAPEGPGGQVRIGKAENPEPGTVRHLISEVALLSVEGGARVAIVEQAHRLNEDAQNALLKLLEEPPPGVTLILCADDEECLLPTVRSRCVRVRLGSVPIRQVETWLVQLGLADAPTAARLAHLAAGRPGLALAYARSGNADRIRGEIGRGLLDMLVLGRQRRLAAVRDLLKSAIALQEALELGRNATDPPLAPAARTRTKRGGVERGADAAPDGAVDAAAAESEPAASAAPENTEAPGGKVSASDRRAAAAALIEIWAEIGRDLMVAASAAPRQLRSLDLLDEIRAAGPRVPTAVIAAFLARLGEIAGTLDQNVNSELALDVLALAWPHVDAATSTVDAASLVAARP